MPDRLRDPASRLVGAKQTLKAAESGRATAVYVARDADERVIAPILVQAQQHDIEVVYVESMSCLGRMCGIEVGAAAAAIRPRQT